MQKLEQIWIIEDDEVTRFLKERVVQKAQVANEVCVFQHADVAMAKLEKCNGETNRNAAPELILLDLNMPRMTGLGFLETLYNKDLPERFDKLRLAILSAETNLQDIDTALAYSSVLTFVQKPLTNQSLLKLIDTYFESIAEGREK